MGKSLNPKLRESQFFSPGRRGPVPTANGASRWVRALGFRVSGLLGCLGCLGFLGLLGFLGFRVSELYRDSALPSRLGFPVVSFCPFVWLGSFVKTEYLIEKGYPFSCTKGPLGNLVGFTV